MIDHRFNDCKKFFGALAARYRGNFQDDFKVSNALSEQFVAPFRYLQTTPIVFVRQNNRTTVFSYIKSFGLYFAAGYCQVKRD